VSKLFQQPLQDQTSNEESVKKNSERKCKHIAQLPPIPTTAEISAHRKNLGKIKLPTFKANDFGGHEELGQFVVVHDGDFYFEWHLAGKENKRYKFDELCDQPDLELERLELGWLIGNIYSLNEIHDLENLGVPHDEYTLKEYARLTNWYGKRETMWYRWAVSAPRHMLSVVKKKRPTTRRPNNTKRVSR
jgi:hypothetical protein